MLDGGVLMVIREESVRSVHDIETLLSFLGEELDWPLPPQPTLEEVTFEWNGTELNLSEDTSRRLKGGVVRQIRPFRDGQPWGIFLIEFTGPKVYISTLRQILSRLVSSRRSRSDLPAWHCENLLFLCSSNDGGFTFAHFRTKEAPPDKRRKPPKLITFGWEPGEPIHTLCKFNLPSLRYDPDWDDETWLREWDRAFDVEKVTEEFFRGFREIFGELQKVLYSQVRGQDDEGKLKRWAHDYALQLLSRIMSVSYTHLTLPTKA